MKKFLYIILMGLFIGSLHGTVVLMLHQNEGYERVFQFIASGIFGNKAFIYGTLMVFVGITFHYLITIIWSLIFVQFYNAYLAISHHCIILGIIFGIIIWSTMNFFVIPISNTPSVPFRMHEGLLQLIIHIALIGIPIAFLTRKYYLMNISSDNT